jgi:hypothetical protein
VTAGAGDTAGFGRVLGIDTQMFGVPMAVKIGHVLIYDADGDADRKFAKRYSINLSGCYGHL